MRNLPNAREVEKTKAVIFHNALSACELSELKSTRWYQKMVLFNHQNKEKELLEKYPKVIYALQDF
jgi:hypothetical protein